MVEVRPATQDDWPAIRLIFREVVEAGETYAYDPAWTDDQAREVWMERRPSQVVVAVADGNILGTAKFGPNRPGRGSHVGTASFMVGSAARGHGVGRLLGTYVIDACRAAGFRAIQFNAVVETNTAAVALWTSLGFRVIGTVPKAFDHPRAGLVGLHVMYLPLTEPAASAEG